jgi:tRNA-modifying protein YgfZ
MTDGYRSLRERAASIDLSTRGKIRVTGEDRARLLHALSTNDIEHLKPGQGCYAFFLNAQGRILADANILCFEDHLLLDTEPETRQKLFEHLDRYIIADDVTIEDQPEIFTTSMEGPEAGLVLAQAGAPIPEAPYSWLPWGDSIVARIDSTGTGGFFIFHRAPLVLDLPMATAEDARTVRIENGRPRYGEEISDRFLVQETGQLRGVHFNKGCYLGQEIVERVRSQAKIHRVLRRLEIDTADPPPAGTKTDQAEIVSSAFSPALGKTLALAYVRIQFADPGTQFQVNNSPARVH